MNNNQPSFSMKEYQPVPLNERINNLENKRFEVMERRTPLIDRKKEIELELSECVSEIKGTYLTAKDY